MAGDDALDRLRSALDQFHEQIAFARSGAPITQQEAIAGVQKDGMPPRVARSVWRAYRRATFADQVEGMSGGRKQPDKPLGI